MSFTILTATANSDGVFESVGWAYSTSLGMITGDHTLQMPRGDVSLESVDAPTIIGWISSQMDTRSFDSLCAAHGFYAPAEDIEYVIDTDGVSLIVNTGVGSTGIGSTGVGSTGIGTTA